jgi:hypothetical protein
MGLGSEVRDLEKTYSGSRIRIRNYATHVVVHWVSAILKVLLV